MSIDDKIYLLFKIEKDLYILKIKQTQELLLHYIAINM